MILRALMNITKDVCLYVSSTLVPIPAVSEHSEVHLLQLVQI